GLCRQFQDDPDPVSIQTPTSIRMSDISQDLPGNGIRINPCVRGELSQNAEQVPLDRHFDSDTGAGIGHKTSVEDRITDLIAYLVRVTVRDAFRREQASHGLHCCVSSL